MTNAPPKKRPWFQLHLSTCVVLMFVAGGLITVNLTPLIPRAGSSAAKWFGWPNIAFPYLEWPAILYEMSWDCFLIDAGSSLGILGLTAFVCEKWLVHAKTFLLKRRRIQLHLATCVVLLVIASSLLGVNVLGRSVTYERNPWEVRGRVFGWPWEAWIEVQEVGYFSDKEWTPVTSVEMVRAQATLEKEVLTTSFVAVNAIKNGIAALAILIAGTFVCEYVLRRRLRARAAQEPAP